MNDTITIHGPLGTYDGIVRGYDPFVGPGGAVVVFVTKLHQITSDVPEWAIHPSEKVGKRCNFSPQCVGGESGA